MTTGIQLGSYEILAPLGKGGMGKVYRARDTRLNREVAIKELFFTDADRKLMAATVKTSSGTFETEVPKLLFETTPLSVPGRNRFVVSSDGQRFLVITRLEGPLTPINVVLNWTAEIRK